MVLTTQAPQLVGSIILAEALRNRLLEQTIAGAFSSSQGWHSVTVCDTVGNILSGGQVGQYAEKGVVKVEAIDDGQTVQVMLTTYKIVMVGGLPRLEHSTDKIGPVQYTPTDLAPFGDAIREAVWDAMLHTQLMNNRSKRRQQPN